MFRQVLNPANAINSFAKSLFPFLGLDCAKKKTQVLIVLVKGIKIWYLEEGKVLPRLVDTAIFF